ncbi:peptidoglycan DD-metalloendopeptidase family protein [Bacteroidales bacterium OttesenSCG-928-E04]|nr:peptidoglycan DD-metalloendopeptidase family protein [Bacteroidales bacterium OttesenSCG-928-E04]MDL2326488.1 peptidoglycan DD-metalloendopeptidase family protein [Bacteroidales bacterium OttesenSCG-928-A14]
MKKNIFLIIAILAVSILTVFTQTKSEQLKKNKKQIENEIANTQKLLNQTKQNKNTSLQQISMLRKQISNREQLITALNNEIFELEKELDLNIKLSQSLDKKLEYMKADYSRIVYQSYKNRRMIDKVTFVLASEDFTQMYRRFKYYTIFAENVKHQVELIRETQEEIKTKNQAILLLKEEKSQLLTGKEQEIRKLEVDRNAKTRTAENLKKQEKQLANELSNKQKKRKELDAAIKKAIQDEILAANAKKAKDAKAKGSSTIKEGNRNEIALTPEEKVLSNSFVSNQGKLPWPVEKGVKVSDFGNYPHPDVPSVMIENRGIDILVEEGTQIRAVFDGEVTAVMDVLGTKVLMIRHGEYLTVYQNLKDVKVKKGDKVKTKQVIATVSRSSGATSTELHFEVWKNNTYLNPNSWLARK